MFYTLSVTKTSSPTIDDLDRYRRLPLGRRQLVAARHQVVLALGDVAQVDVEDVPIVVRVDHDHVDHGPPVGDLGFEQRRVHLQALDDGGRDEVLDLDHQGISLAFDRHLGLGRLVEEELAVFLISAQLDHVDLVDRAALVVLRQPGVDGQLLAQADHGDVPLLARTGLELILDQLQVQRGKGMVEGHDLDQVLAPRAVEERIGLGLLDAHQLHRQVDCLVVLHLQVVVVDLVDGKG